MEEVSIATPDGYQVPLEVFAAAEPRAMLLLLPALGVQARLYRKFASALADEGVTTMLLEQRGHGRSALQPSRDVDYGFKEWLEVDIPAALDHLQSLAPERKIFLAGHSLGGHLALMTRALYPKRSHGVILLATASPWHRGYRGGMRGLVILLTGLIPVLSGMLGYYPGTRLGFGGREARRLMADWLVMARHNRYSAAGMATDFEALLQADSCPVLSVYGDRDALAPLNAIENVTKRLPNHTVDWLQISSEQLGKQANHVAWAQQGEVAAQAVAEWLGAHLDSSP